MLLLHTEPPIHNTYHNNISNNIIKNNIINLIYFYFFVLFCSVRSAFKPTDVSRHMKSFEHRHWGPYEKNLILFFKRSNLIKIFFIDFERGQLYR